MTLTRRHLALLAINVVSVVGFGAYYLSLRNYEFVIYAGVIVVAGAAILATYRKVDYSLATLVGLTVWALLHMGGGAIPVGGGRLYDLILLPLSDEYPIFRYDQFVHIFGFGTSTLLIYDLLHPLLRPSLPSTKALSVVVVMAGLGVGALNEIVEFGVVCVVPESGVGGFVNMSLDLVADFIGAVLGMVYIRFVRMPRENLARAA